MRAWVLLLTFFLVGHPLFSQENCANGIDDDQDGLVDLNDKADCSCALSPTVTSLLPNPSLEEFNDRQAGCTSEQPGGRPDAVNQANCLSGWQRVSMGTTDSWNAFTFTGAGPYFPASLPLPLPSGTGIGGFWVGVRDTPNSRFLNGDGSTAERYREYLAANFVDGQRLRAGADYRLTFSLGFMQPQMASEGGIDVSVASPDSVELSVYGVREPHQLNFGSFYDCPETAGAEGYERIATITVSGAPGGWSAATLDFVAANDYAGFAIGGSCAPDRGRADNGNYRNYYFIDDLILNRAAAFDEFAAGAVSVDGLTVCDETIVLSGQLHAGASYQWYRNGVAIPNATVRVLRLAGGPAVDGRYVLRVTTPQGCALTEPVVIQRPVITDHFVDTITFCQDMEQARIGARRFTGATYRWDDGTTEAYRHVTTPGTYAVTVTENCVEHVEKITVQDNAPFGYSLSATPALVCAGEPVTVAFSSPTPNTRVYFRSLATGKDLPQQDGKLRLSAGEEAAVLVFMSNDCGTSIDTVFLPVAESFHLDNAVVEDITCSTGAGHIEITVDRPQRVHYEWRDANGRLVGEDEPYLSVATPGNYSVSLTDGVRCPQTFTYTVGNVDSFTADISVEQPSCGAGGRIAINAITGDYPYSVKWFKNGKGEYEEGNSSVRSNLSGGAYDLHITDAGGCTIEKSVTLSGPAPLTASVVSGYEECESPTSGFLEVSGEGGTLPYSYLVAGHEDQVDGKFSGLTAGTYQARIRDANGCYSEPLPVTLRQAKLPEIELGPDRYIKLGDSVVLDAGPLDLSPAGGSLSWTSAQSLSCADCTDPIASPVQNTSYTVSYLSPDQCAVTDSVKVFVDRSPRIYVPNAFSPNGDGHNDVFRVFIPDPLAVLTELTIYDRWGEMIWTKDDTQDGSWDGTFRGKLLSVGVYVYTGKVRLRDNSFVSLEGSVTLVR